jgi:hypothetical protein
MILEDTMIAKIKEVIENVIAYVMMRTPASKDDSIYDTFMGYRLYEPI